MTAPSPAINDAAQLALSIKVDGKEINTTKKIVGVDTCLAVNRVPKATFVLFDGSAATRDFEASNLKTFLPGNKVEIAAGYGSSTTSIFKGVIVKQGIEITRDEGSKLIVHLTDEAIKMTLERNNALFEKVKDSDLIGQLIT